MMDLGFRGERARLGIIVPGRNYVVEGDMHRMAPIGVEVITTRMLERGGDDSREGLMEMLQELEHSTKTLKGVDAVALCELAGTILEGPGWERRLIERIKAVLDVPATVGAEAMMESMKEMGIGKVSLAMPYRSEEIRQALIRFIEEGGVRVVKEAHPDRPIPVLEVTEQPPIMAYKLAKRANSQEADGVFIASTDLRAIETISLLEEDLRKPVISINQALMWRMLKLLGLRPKIEGYGSLLERLSKPS